MSQEQQPKSGTKPMFPHGVVLWAATAGDAFLARAADHADQYLLLVEAEVIPYFRERLIELRDFNAPRGRLR